MNHHYLFFGFFLIRKDGLDEMVVFNVTVGIFMTVQKFVAILWVEFFTELGQNVTEFVSGDLARTVFVEDLKYIFIYHVFVSSLPVYIWSKLWGYVKLGNANFLSIWILPRQIEI